VGETKKIKSIFDVDIEAGKGDKELEAVIVQPNPDNKNAISVFLKKVGCDPRKYYDISIFVLEKECGLARLVIEGDNRCAFIRLEGDKVRYYVGATPETVAGVVKNRVLIFLERGFSKLKIEATVGNIVFTAT